MRRSVILARGNERVAIVLTEAVARTALHTVRVEMVANAGMNAPAPSADCSPQRSRRTTDELHNSRPRWLRRISRGANLVLLAVVVAIAGLFAYR